MSSYTIRAHDGKVNTKAFDYGQVKLNEYIRRYASQAVKRDLARVFIATSTNDLAYLAGFLVVSIV